MMARRSRGFNERRTPRVEHKRLLVVTEGEKTEVQYLQGLVQYLRSSGVRVVSMTPKGVGRDPLSVVRAAVDLQGRDDDKYDQTWVLVDVDEHATLSDAISEGKRENVSVVVSNPCFEIWLVWHYADCAAYHSTKEATARLKKLGHTAKSIPTSFPYDAHVDATRRAGGGIGRWKRGPNPSSAMPQLLAALLGSSHHG